MTNSFNMANWRHKYITMSEIANEIPEVDSAYYDRNKAAILASIEKAGFGGQEAEEIFDLMKGGLSQGEAIAKYTEAKYGDYQRDKGGDREDDTYVGDLKEEENPVDMICMDVPLFIRMLEFAREDASTDMDLHDVAEKAVKLSAEGQPMTMQHYDQLIATEAPATDAMSLYEKYFKA